MCGTARSRLLWLVCLACAWMALVAPGPARAEKVDSPPRDKGRSEYELRAASGGKSAYAIRFRPATGKSWGGGSDAWFAIEETGDVPAGDYDVIMVGLESGVAAYRIDRLTGAGWYLKNSKWVKFKEPE